MANVKPSITGPLFKWFGSKWGASISYPIPKYNTIYEPFAGSAGYSLRYYWKNVTIYDINPLLSQLWKWLINEAEHKDIINIPIDFAEGTDIKSLDLSEGQQLLLKHWQRTNNYGECWTVSPWGNKPGQWTESTRKRVAFESMFIKHWKFEPITYKNSGTYFIDPPYQYNYMYGIKKFDHSKLAVQINSIPELSQIIACEAICPKSGKIPDYLPFQTLGNFITSRRKEGNNVYSKELMFYRE